MCVASLNVTSVLSIDSTAKEKQDISQNESNTPTFFSFLFPGDFRVSAIVRDSGSHSQSRPSACHLQYATFHECTQTELSGGCGISD